MSSGIHPWVRQFDDRVGWGLQAIALPNDPDPAQSMVDAGLLADKLDSTVSSSAIIRRMPRKCGCTWRR